MKRIILAGGCFWGVEAYLKKQRGILKTRVGYVNGKTENPTYEEVCTKNTGFAEGCYIEYDEEQLSLRKLLEAFWKIIDPTTLNRQGHDIGSQYRTGVYYYEEADTPIILSSRELLQKNLDKRVVTEVEVVRNFYEAEEYHQDYLRKNPSGYCHIPRELFDK